jgi:hypothetical protein
LKDSDDASRHGLHGPFEAISNRPSVPPPPDTLIKITQPLQNLSGLVMGTPIHNPHFEVWARLLKYTADRPIYRKILIKIEKQYRDAGAHDGE